jgi:transaldolase
MTRARLQELAELGQSVWVDFVSRRALRDGEIEALIRDRAVVGMTSNPTIFERAIASGDAYDEQLRGLVDAGECDPRELFIRLAVADIQDACDLLAGVYERTEHLDGFVSIEVDPGLAFERERTVEEARRLHGLIDRPNVFIKIPATEPGLGAIEDAIAQDIPINVTLIFGLDRYHAVAEAYLRGLERLVGSGGDPSNVPSVASFFVSRVDTETDKRLDKLGREDLKGKLAIANAKLAYAACKEIFAGDRWEALKAKGARPQRCLWASTSTKNPSYPDTLYVDELIGPETVNTMPPETIEAFQDHGTVEPTLERDVDGARKLLDDLAEAGIEYDDVIATLEREGVEKFADSFRELEHGIEAKRQSFAAASGPAAAHLPRPLES